MAGRVDQRWVLFWLGLLSGCGGLPIDWDYWSLPVVEESVGRVLRIRAGAWEERLFQKHVSPEGVLLYRIPREPSSRAGHRLDLADQAVWTGYLLAGLSCRYACDGSAEALGRLRGIVRGLRRLHDVTGTPGLIARCLVPEALVPALAHREEDWHRSETIPGYAYRGDPSKDQYSGFVLGLSAAASLVDDDEVRETARDLLRTIADHLDRGGLRIRDGNNRVTRFGDLRGRILGVPIGVNAILSYAILHAAATLAPSPSARKALESRGPGLLRASRRLHFELFGIRNYNNDIMSAAALATIALSPGAAPVRRQLRPRVEDFLAHFRGEGNAFLYSIGALYGVRDGEEERSALRNLISAPEDLGRHTFSSALYDGLRRRLLPDRKGRRRSRTALPLAYRPPSSFVWRSNPYSLRNGAGSPNDFIVSGVDYLFAYWLGRFTGWIPEPS